LGARGEGANALASFQHRGQQCGKERNVGGLNVVKGGEKM